MQVCVICSGVEIVEISNPAQRDPFVSPSSPGASRAAALYSGSAQRCEHTTAYVTYK